MVMTVLEAHVALDRVGDLERAFQTGASALPPGLVESFLVRDAQDTTLFRILTLWASQEALEQMRASVEKPNRDDGPYGYSGRRWRTIYRRLRNRK